MAKLTFKDIEEKGLLIYRYVRGSTCQGTNTPDSDIDEGGVYICPPEQLLDLGFDYQDEVANESHDIVWYELNKFVSLLIKSNPTVLEALFVDDEFVIYEHPIMTEIKKHRDLFITKECFKPFFGYSRSQIQKARGFDKKCAWDEAQMVRKSSLDFCYTFYKQGTTKMQNWLDYRGLRQDCCGLVNLPNMHNAYGVFYDYGQHFELEGYTFEDATSHFFEMLDKYGSTDKCNDILRDDRQYCFVRYLFDSHLIDHRMRGPRPKFNTQILHYRGIFKNDQSTQVGLSSIDDKNDVPICHMFYNVEGFTVHCKKYKEYLEWKEKRNPVRYEQNKSKNYDSKNMAHCFRLAQMAIEIANGEGMKVRRTDDRQFLIDVKNHKFEYEELMDKLTEKNKEMDEAMKNSTITESVDVDKVNDILLKIRKEQIKTI